MKAARCLLGAGTDDANGVCPSETGLLVMAVVAPRLFDSGLCPIAPTVGDQGSDHKR